MSKDWYVSLNEKGLVGEASWGMIETTLFRMYPQPTPRSDDFYLLSKEVFWDGGKFYYYTDSGEIRAKKKIKENMLKWMNLSYD